MNSASDHGEKEGDKKRSPRKSPLLKPSSKLRSFESDAKILSQLRDNCKPTVIDHVPPLTGRSAVSAILHDREWVDKSPPHRTDFLVEETRLTPPVFPFSLAPGLCPSPTTDPIMEEHDRSPSPNRSSLPPPLHRHLRS